MEDPEKPEGQPSPYIPFNNLYLVSGLVHGFNKFWMYLTTILLFVFGYVGYQLLAFTPLANRLVERGYERSEILENPNLLLNADALDMNRNLVLAIELGMFVFAFFGFYMGLRRLHAKTLQSVLTGFQRFRFKRFWFAFALWGGLITLATLVEYNSSEQTLQIAFNPEGFLGSALVLICLMPLQVGIEELIFRGYLMQGLGLAFRNALAPLLITTLLFGLAHMSNPEVKKHGWEVMLPYYCLNAFFFGVLTLLDEGLELAYGLHLGNNIVSGLLVTTPNSVIQPYTIFIAKTEDPGVEIVAWLIMSTLAFAIFWARYRWKNFGLLIR